MVTAGISLLLLQKKIVIRDGRVLTIDNKGPKGLLRWEENHMYTRDDCSARRSETFVFRPVVALIASALLLTGCGGESSPPATVTDNQNQTSAADTSSTSGTSSNTSSTSDAGSSTGSNSDNVIPDSRGGGFFDRSNTARSATNCINGSVPFSAGQGADDTGLLIPNDSPSAANGFYIDTSGGNGGNNGGKGGDGGCVDIFQPGGMAGLRVKGPAQSSPADSSFQPYTPSVNLGSNALVVGANTVAANVTSEPAQGVPYVLRTDRNLYISDGDGTIGDEAPVTGVHVKQGATLTFGLNFGSGDYLQLILANDVHNEGVITTQDDDEGERGGILIYAASYIGSQGSVVDTSAHAAGQNGGGVDFIVDYSIYNAGTFTTMGGDNSGIGSAGDGGNVNFAAEAGLENTGPIITSGGNSTTGGAGGKGGDVDIKTYLGNGFNSAAITTNGGSGVVQGGDGGNIAIRVTGVGVVKNSGDLIGAGGNASNGPAGTGGDIGLYTDGGGIRNASGALQVALANTGDVVSKGGSSSGDVASGGTAGDVTFQVDYGSLTEAWQPVGHMEISGNIDASGGHAAPDGSGRGGAGGLVVIELNAKLHSLDQYLYLLGYGEINASGGSGNNGGDAGMVGMMTQFGDTAAEFLTPSGDVENHADIIAVGGDATPGVNGVLPAKGGKGGDVSMETEYYCGMFDVVFFPILPDIKTMEHTTNAATINTSGGKNVGINDEASDAGAAGDVMLWGYNRVANTGAISANGGIDIDTTDGKGGKGGNISMLTELGEASNEAAIAADGGDAKRRGGDAGDLVALIAAGAVYNAGSVSAVGGDSDGTVSGSKGGSGGLIEIYSQSGPQAVTANELTVGYEYAGGAGESTGSTGGLAIGGLCKEGEC